jgi:flagellar biosynthesis/type III secretory pathway chaperone
VNSGIKELIAALTKKREALECLQAILEEEKPQITGLDPEGLKKSSSRKDQVFEKLADLNVKCLASLMSAHAELGVSGDRTLSTLIERLQGPDRVTLRNLQKEIFAVVGKNERLLVLNKGLLESSLSFTDRSLKLFTKFLTSGGTYGGAGHMMEGHSRARLLCREV